MVCFSRSSSKPITIDHVAAAVAETSSGMATPLYGLRGIQIAHGMMAIMAIKSVNAPNFRLTAVCIKAADWINNDSGNAAKNATETM